MVLLLTINIYIHCNTLLFGYIRNSRFKEKEEEDEDGNCKCNTRLSFIDDDITILSANTIIIIDITTSDCNEINIKYRIRISLHGINQET